MATVSRGAITQKIKSKTLILNSGGMMDTDNPVNRAYLDRHHQQNKEKAAAEAFIESQKKDVAAIKENQKQIISNNPQPNKNMLQMTLGEIIAAYQDLDGVDKYIKIQKDLVTIEEKQQRLQEKRLQLLPKDFVIARLFGFQQQQASRVLDVPDAAADQLQALVLADPKNCRQKIIEYLRDLLSRAIGGAKEHVINELQSLRSKYDHGKDEESLSEKIDALMEQSE